MSKVLNAVGFVFGFIWSFFCGFFGGFNRDLWEKTKRAGIEGFEAKGRRSIHEFPAAIVWIIFFIWFIVVWCRIGFLPAITTHWARWLCMVGIFAFLETYAEYLKKLEWYDAFYDDCSDVEKRNISPKPTSYFQWLWQSIIK